MLRYVRLCDTAIMAGNGGGEGQEQTWYKTKKAKRSMVTPLLGVKMLGLIRPNLLAKLLAC